MIIEEEPLKPFVDSAALFKQHKEPRWKLYSNCVSNYHNYYNKCDY